MEKSRYYQQLDLKPGAGIAEVKKAYRRKAMELHPDKNPDPAAKEKFIELTEAYYALTNPAKNSVKQKFASANPFVKKNPAKRQEDARERARRAAQMHYEEWLKSDEYELETAIGVFMQHLMLLVFGLFLLGCIIGFIFSDGGVASIVLLLLFLGPIYFAMVYHSENISVANFVSSFKNIQEQRPVGEVFLSLLNLFIFLRIGLQTLLPIDVMILIYVLLPTLAYFYFRKKKVFSVSLLSIGLAPTVFSVFLLLNYFISFNTVSETYAYKVNVNSFKIQKTSGACSNLFTTIELDNRQYQAYPGIRFFFDNDHLCALHYIEYEFKQGIFGLKVMTAYKGKYTLD